MRYLRSAFENTRTASVMLALLVALCLAVPASFAAPIVNPLPHGWQYEVIPDMVSDYSPSIEDFKGRLFIVVTGKDNNIYVNSVGPDGQNWGSWRSIPGLSAAYSPAIKIFNKRLYVVAVGTNGQIHLTSSKDGLAWSIWSVVPNMVTTQGLALKPFKDRLYIAARDPNGTISINSTKNGTSWDAWRAVPGSYNRNPRQPALTQFNGQLVLGFTKAGDEYIAITSSKDGKRWSTPIQAPSFGQNCDDFPAPLRTPSGPGLAVLNGRLYVSANAGGCDVEVFIRMNSYDGAQWSGWYPLGLDIKGALTMTTFEDRLYMTAPDWERTRLYLFFQS